MDATKQQFNMKLYPFYKMLSWDSLFFYSIQFIFFTQVKNIPAPLVLLADSFYSIFKFTFQVPCLALAGKLKLKNSIVLGNFLVAIGILSYIALTGVPSLIIANFFQALGFNLKGICETDMIYSSIPKNSERGKTFSKIDGKSSSYYYFFDAITAVCSGFLFIINGYLPIILCFMMSILSAIISLRFYSPDENIENKEEKKYKSPKIKLKHFKSSVKFIFGSKRLRSLLIFSGLFHGLIAVSTTLRSSLFVDINVPNEYFGIIFAVFGIVSGISSKNSNWFHKKYKNETLMNFSLTYTITFMIAGVVALTIKNTTAKFIIIISVFLIQYVVNGPYYTLVKRYLSNFSTSLLRPKLYTANTFVESVGKATLYLVSSILLKHTSTAHAFAILGSVATIIFIFILSYMKPRIGLTPEQYNKKDIEFNY